MLQVCSKSRRRIWRTGKYRSSKCWLEGGRGRGGEGRDRVHLGKLTGIQASMVMEVSPLGGTLTTGKKTNMKHSIIMAETPGCLLLHF